jgi:allantoinase
LGRCGHAIDAGDGNPRRKNYSGLNLGPESRDQSKFFKSRVNFARDGFQVEILVSKLRYSGYRVKSFMPTFDLIVRGGTLVRHSSLEISDLGVSDGKIVALESEILGSAGEEIDARGLHIFPGVIDAHVHFNEPGRTDWEGISSGSRAFAAGGGTTFVDMPLNSSPVTIDGPSFDLKLAAMQASSLTDFALWGGLVPGNLEHLPELASRGVMGFKAFMSNSGLTEFDAADDLTLLEGMRVAATLGLPVAVHAESDSITLVLSSRLRAAGKTGIRDYLESRPVLAELEAISRAILLAEETGCALHIVHISSGRGVALAAQARARGVNVTLETCPHYLAFTDDDLERLGAVLKCAPPVRNLLERDHLWREVLTGQVDIIGSDHSPAPPEMKTQWESSGDFFAIWGGISGVQSTLAVMLSEGVQARGLPLGLVAKMLATKPAERFGFAYKGKLEIGFDADISLLDLSRSFTLEPEALLYRHTQSPYLGQKFAGVINRTVSRGQTIFRDGVIVEGARGQFVRPTLSKKA